MPAVFAAQTLETEQEHAARIVMPPAGQFLTMVRVKPGDEGLVLSARLSENSTDPTQGINWKIRNFNGEVVFAGDALQAVTTTAPGDYLVEASYGFTNLRENITLPVSSRLNISFVLNAGALRVLPRVKSIPVHVPGTSRVFATDGPLKGKLIATTRIPGEVLMVHAGSYRIESTFDSGNNIAVTDVDVRPGIMSAVDIDHIAGVVDFITARSRTWKIMSETGELVTTFNATTHDVVLKPGDYTAEAEGLLINDSIAFSVEPGQQIEISLPD